jgi:hypothetical protein
MNAREELIKDVGSRRVAYGKVIFDTSYGATPKATVAFGSHEDYLAALPALDFEYDAGYGGQELFGFVVFEDGSWLERGEYDGSEWWAYKKTPTRESVATFVTT